MLGELHKVGFASQKGDEKIERLAGSSCVGDQAGVPSFYVVIRPHSLLVN